MSGASESVVIIPYNHIACSNGEHDTANCRVCILLNTVNQPYVVLPASVSKPRIQAVSRRLREVESNSKCYDPVFVSIGPYHHGKPEYQSVEKIKYMSAQRVISMCNLDTRSMYDRVASLVPEARQNYADDILNKFSGSEFANMMFLDSCFILDFISNGSDWVKNYSSIDLLKADLFLLENQLPYFVLEALMEELFDAQNWKSRILSFVRDMISGFSGRGARNSFPGTENRPIHLLDFFRSHLFSDHGTPPPFADSMEKFYRWTHSTTFPSVKDFKAQGINFTRTYNDRLDVVRFSSGRVYGELSLPSLDINESTKILLLNLAAYEMCPDSSLNYKAISYICLMGDLITDAQDVNLLREQGIIFNSFGSNIQVADQFNQLPTHLVQDPNMYMEVAKGLGEHRQRKLALALISFVNTNFTSWTSMGAAAAASGLILTLLQTIYTMR